MRKSPRKNLPPRNTLDLFCRRFTPTKSSLRCVGGTFLFHKQNLMQLFNLPKFVFSCWSHNLKVLFLCLKEARCSVRTAPGFLHTAPWILNKPSERDTAPWPHTFRGRAGQRRCKTGVGTAFGVNGDQHTRAAELSTYFCALTIRKHLLKMRFERSGRGQEPSRGHKFSILENFLSIRDFTSAMRLHLRSDLVGACLPQTLLIIRALRHEWNGVSCFT